ncbi:hypothetical protein FOA52_001833 [Chlamydomonas sp. UWO 241]|nr:hypothetical protein FOA52_001833 [Chlamydomonas sp. UWO 241]
MVAPKGRVLPLALLVCACSASVVSAQQWCVKSRDGLSGFSGDVYRCGSVPPFLISYLWSPVEVDITCPTSRYAVYLGYSDDLLRKNINERATTFCGSSWFLLDSRRCRFQISPFWSTYVAIKDGKGCTVDSSVRFNTPMLVSALLGISMFYAAPLLTSSPFFRVSCGSVMFATGSLAILCFMLMRVVPHKRSVATALTVMGSSGMAALRWFTGHWLPSWTALSQNPVFQAYVAVSAVVGAGLTYWFDDRRSTKLNMLILVALRLGGLALVFFGTWMLPVAFAGVVGVLLTSLVSQSVQQEVHRNVTQTGAHIGRVATATAAAARRLSPFSTPTSGLKEGGPPRGSHGAAAAVGCAAAAGSPPGFSFWGSMAGGPGGGGGGSGAGRRARSATDEARAQLGLPVDHPRALHLRTPPPDPWSMYTSAGGDDGARVRAPPPPPPRVVAFEDKYTEAVMRKGAKRGSGAGAAGAASPSKAAASGGRSSARLGSGGKGGALSSAAASPMDISPQSGGAAAAGGRVGAGAGAATPANDRLARGCIGNPLTGRTIKIGGDTYMRMLDNGWEPDLTSGVMVGGGGGGGGGGSAGASPSSAESPGTRARRRGAR